MKVLWITNTIFPDISKELGLKVPVVGGWMYSLAKILLQNSSLELAVASVYQGKILICKIVNGVTYFLLPSQGKETKYFKKMEEYWKDIQRLYQPDIIHIHGTEYTYGLAYIRACSNKNVIVSIQGLVSVYERYYYTGMTNNEILRNLTFRDIIRNDNLFQQRMKMRKRGVMEQECIKSTNHVIGRTSWDKAHALAINPAVSYHFCNETLRAEFYKHKWSLKNCEKHSIFLSQSVYPIKGLHQVLKTLPIVLTKYPDTKLYVAGIDFTSVRSFKDRIRKSGYSKYIFNLMNKLKINDKVVFTGLLNESEMCSRYLKSHLFICPSTIENSPNSVGEAQVLGVPCIASYVGGVPDMIENGSTGLLYRFEEVEMLAKNICDVFDNDDLAETLSANEQICALKRHSLKENEKTILKIYNTFMQDL